MATAASRGAAGSILTTWQLSATDRFEAVYVYFDNGAKVHAPFDALRLAERLGVGPALGTTPVSDS